MIRWAPGLLLLVSCGLPEGAQKVLVFGHGGMGPDAGWPMDTRESVEACLALGADGVEVDLHLTADSVLIAYHDEDLSNSTDCAGRVNAHRWEDLQRCAYPQPHSDADAGSPGWPPPRLLAADTLAARRPGALTFDCKLFAAGEWNDYLGAFVHALNALVTRNALQDRVNIECMDVGFLDRVKAGVQGGAIFLYATDAKAGIDTARAHGFDGITIDRRLISIEQVRAAHDAGLRVAVFGADGNWSHRRALALGADMIQTDDPRGLLELLGR